MAGSGDENVAGGENFPPSKNGHDFCCGYHQKGMSSSGSTPAWREVLAFGASICFLSSIGCLLLITLACTQRRASKTGVCTMRPNFLFLYSLLSRVTIATSSGRTEPALASSEIATFPP